MKLSRLIHFLFKRHSVSEFEVIGSCRCRTLFHHCAWGLNYSFCLYWSVIEVIVVKWAFGFRELSLSSGSVEVKVYPALKRCLLQFDNTCFQFWDVFIVRSRNTFFSWMFVSCDDLLQLCHFRSPHRYEFFPCIPTQFFMFEALMDKKYLVSWISEIDPKRPNCELPAFKD